MLTDLVTNPKVLRRAHQLMSEILDNFDDFCHIAGVTCATVDDPLEWLGLRDGDGPRPPYIGLGWLPPEVQEGHGLTFTYCPEVLAVFCAQWQVDTGIDHSSYFYAVGMSIQAHATIAGVDIPDEDTRQRVTDEALQDATGPGGLPVAVHLDAAESYALNAMAAQLTEGEPDA